MELKGTVEVPTSTDNAFKILTTPEYLLRTMPGLKELNPTGDNQYSAVLEMGIAAIKGRYNGVVRLMDPRPGEGYTLSMEGDGPIGFINMELKVELAPSDQGTAVKYQGEAHVGGTAAGVGQRMLSGVAKMVLNQFFNAVKKEAKAL